MEQQQVPGTICRSERDRQPSGPLAEHDATNSQPHAPSGHDRPDLDSILSVGHPGALLGSDDRSPVEQMRQDIKIDLVESPGHPGELDGVQD